MRWKHTEEVVRSYLCHVALQAKVKVPDFSLSSCDGKPLVVLSFLFLSLFFKCNVHPEKCTN